MARGIGRSMPTLPLAVASPQSRKRSALISAPVGCRICRDRQNAAPILEALRGSSSERPEAGARKVRRVEARSLSSVAAIRRAAQRYLRRANWRSLSRSRAPRSRRDRLVLDRNARRIQSLQILAVIRRYTSLTQREGSRRQSRSPNRAARRSSGPARGMCCLPLNGRKRVKSSRWISGTQISVCRRRLSR